MRTSTWRTASPRSHHRRRLRAGRRLALLPAVLFAVAPACAVHVADADSACSSPGACPSITSVLPVALSYNRTEATPMTVNGTRLDIVSSALLEPGDAPLEFQLQGSDHMTVTVPTGVTAGDHWLVLTSPFGDSDHQPPPMFQIIAPSPAPETDGPAVSFDPAPGATASATSAAAATLVPAAAPAVAQPPSDLPWAAAGAATGAALVLGLAGFACFKVVRRLQARRRLRSLPVAEPPPPEVIDDRLDRL